MGRLAGGGNYQVGGEYKLGGCSMLRSAFPVNSAMVGHRVWMLVRDLASGGSGRTVLSSHLDRGVLGGFISWGLFVRNGGICRSWGRFRGVQDQVRRGLTFRSPCQLGYFYQGRGPSCISSSGSWDLLILLSLRFRGISGSGLVFHYSGL
jgi:hypothetical protein